MQHLHDVENRDILDDEYFANIKLDYSALIVKREDDNFLFYARNFKQITPISLQTRFAILKPGIDIFNAWGSKMATEDGYYHFEYKNPDMEYTIDDGRDSGLYFSYFTDLDGIVRHTSLDSQRETNIKIKRDDLKNLNDADLLIKYGLEMEEGLVIHFYNKDESVKIVNPYFTNYAKLKRSVNSNSKTSRAAVKAFYEQHKEEFYAIFKKHIHNEEYYKTLIFNNSIAIYSSLMEDINLDFLRTNPALLSYYKLFRFYAPNLSDVLVNKQMDEFNRYVGTANYELFSFIYITLCNMLVKDFENEIKELQS